MAVRVAVLFLVLATPALVYAAQHVVGGSGGWNTAGDYSTWAKGEKFTVDDTLGMLYCCLYCYFLTILMLLS